MLPSAPPCGLGDNDEEEGAGAEGKEESFANAEEEGGGADPTVQEEVLLCERREKEWEGESSDNEQSEEEEQAGVGGAFIMLFMFCHVHWRCRAEQSLPNFFVMSQTFSMGQKLK